VGKSKDPERNVEGAREAARVMLASVKMASVPMRGQSAFLWDAFFKATDSRFEPMLAVSLVESAEEGDPVAKEAVHNAIAWFVTEGECVPEILRNYLLELLLLQKSGPKKKGRHHDNYLRDSIIARAVKAAMEYGIDRTRNGAGKEASACSIVADVLAENGVNMSEANVARISDRPSRK
jgi:hypothetical protein